MSTQSPYCIRLATPADIPLLTPIELSAAQRFQEFGLPMSFSTQVTPQSVLNAGQTFGTLWVVALKHAISPLNQQQPDHPVGFALAGIVDNHAHLEELNVHPDHGRQGLGTALVQTTLTWAVQAGFTAMTLTTLRHIPWNAPFYERLGFRILHSDELSSALRALLAAECASGLSGGLPATDRVAMQKMLVEHHNWD